MAAVTIDPVGAFTAMGGPPGSFGQKYLIRNGTQIAILRGWLSVTLVGQFDDGGRSVARVLLVKPSDTYEVLATARLTDPASPPMIMGTRAVLVFQDVTEQWWQTDLLGRVKKRQGDMIAGETFDENSTSHGNPAEAVNAGGHP